ncbi:MAG: NAD(P)H-dependent oxidoreductase [Planctomycetes bacterium]|nr:NAD(P)H-dependent oxidoreductase [Planctomycetota bacterium]
MKILPVVAACVIMLGVSACAAESARRDGPRILIAYFSKTNTTRSIAEHIQSRVGGDMFQVTTATPYPQEYRETTQVARTELDTNARPRLASTISPDTMQNYDIIFIGYPIWWGTMPMAMFTFLEQFDLAGKTLIPFCTHGGSGLSRSAADIGRLAPGATVRQALAVSAGSAPRAQNDIDAWLRGLGFTRQ